MHDFGFDAASATSVTSLVVSLQQASAFVASIFIAPLTERIGRRPALMLSCLVFSIGVVLQVAPPHKLSMFYVGRVIAGLGLGSATTVAPVYCAEMAPKEIRGQLGSCMQWMFTWGIFTSYWIDYAVLETLPATSKQWQIPVGLQMVPAAIIGFGLLTQRESVRWLVKRGRHDEGWESLKWIRASESNEVQAEFNEIVTGITEEDRVTGGLKRRELLEPANRNRLFLSFTVFLCTQTCGSTALAYFGPQVFKLLVGSGDRDLLITALFGVIKVIACGIFIIFFSERVNRRIIFTIGGSGMAVCMILTAVLDKVFPPSGGNVTPAGMAMVAMIFLNIIIYNFSWGPLTWPYVSEIFPSRIREIGVAVGVSTQWLFNFVFTFATPYMVSNLGWGTFLFYAFMDFAMAAFAFFCMKETRGKSIEEMESLFHSKAAFDVELTRKAGVNEMSTGFDKPESAHVENPERDSKAKATL